MNVKISYTVPFEEIPQHLSELLKRVSQKLIYLGEDIRYDMSTNLDKGLVDIDVARKKLASVDFLLADCYTILSSYRERMNGELTVHMHGEENVDDSTTID